MQAPGRAGERDRAAPAPCRRPWPTPRRRRRAARAASAPSALDVAKGELAKGVHEEGVNTGTDVDKYLAAAGVGPGNPWCASFVTWSLAQAGHKMEGSGWAGGADVGARRRGRDQRPPGRQRRRRAPRRHRRYDWGGQEDFGSDGHIGFLASNVEGGKFTALEGNNQDAVMSVPRSTSQANVKFLRIGGTGVGRRRPRPASRRRPSARPPRRPPSSPAAAAARPPPPAAVEPSGGGGAADVAAAAADAGGAEPLPAATTRRKEQIAAWMAKEAEKRGLPPQLPIDGLARRVGHDQHPGRRRRLRRLLPDARRHLEPGRLRRLPRQARAAGQVVPRPGRSRSRRPASPPASRSTTPTPSANGSPTSNAPPSNTAAATNSSSTKPTASSAAPPPPRPPPPPPPHAAARPRRGQAAVAADAAEAAPRRRDAVHGRQGARRRRSGAQAPRDRAVHEGDRPEAGERRRPRRRRRRSPPRPRPPATGPTAAEDAAANQAVGAPVPAGELALAGRRADRHLPRRQGLAGRAREVARPTRRRRPGCRASCRSWRRSWSPA